MFCFLGHDLGILYFEVSPPVDKKPSAPVAKPSAPASPAAKAPPPAGSFVLCVGVA